jgi:hypothetical protein
MRWNVRTHPVRASNVAVEPRVPAFKLRCVCGSRPFFAANGLCLCEFHPHSDDEDHSQASEHVPPSPVASDESSNRQGEIPLDEAPIWGESEGGVIYEQRTQDDEIQQVHGASYNSILWESIGRGDPKLAFDPTCELNHSLYLSAHSRTSFGQPPEMRLLRKFSQLYSGPDVANSVGYSHGSNLETVRCRTGLVLAAWISSYWVELVQPSVLQSLIVYVEEFASRMEGGHAQPVADALMSVKNSSRQPSITEIGIADDSSRSKIALPTHGTWLGDDEKAPDYIPAVFGLSSSPAVQAIPTPRLSCGVQLITQSLQLWELDSLEIARQWTLIDAGLFCSIPMWEFLGKAWSRPRHMRLAPVLRHFIDRFNAVSEWVTSSVLDGVAPEDRARTMDKLAE